MRGEGGGWRVMFRTEVSYSGSCDVSQQKKARRQKHISLAQLVHPLFSFELS
jgi:hypothetical protein